MPPPDAAGFPRLIRRDHHAIGAWMVNHSTETRGPGDDVVINEQLPIVTDGYRIHCLSY